MGSKSIPPQCHGEKSSPSSIQHVRADCELGHCSNIQDILKPFLAFEIRPSRERQNDLSGGPKIDILMSYRIGNMENHNKVASLWRPKTSSLGLFGRLGRYVQRERQQRFYERHKTHARFKRLQRHEEIEFGTA